MLNMTDDKTSESSRIVNHLDLELCHLDRVPYSWNIPKVGVKHQPINQSINQNQPNGKYIPIIYNETFLVLRSILTVRIMTLSRWHNSKSKWFTILLLSLVLSSVMYGLFIRTVLSFIFNLHHARTCFIICNEIYFRYYTNISQLHQPKVYGLATTNDIATFRNTINQSINQNQPNGKYIPIIYNETFLVLRSILTVRIMTLSRW
jgi:hypothetical protein